LSVKEPVNNLRERGPGRNGREGSYKDAKVAAGYLEKIKSSRVSRYWQGEGEKGGAGGQRATSRQVMKCANGYTIVMD